jgi:hypothetical protein
MRLTGPPEPGAARLTLLHHDRDFGVIARVTGQPMRWYGFG